MPSDQWVDFGCEEEFTAEAQRRGGRGGRGGTQSLGCGWGSLLVPSDR